MAVHRSRAAYGGGGGDALDEEDALGLDDDKVDELVEVADDEVDGLAGDGGVLARAELAGKAVAEDELAGYLGGDADAEGHPRESEDIAGDVKIASGQDEREDGNKGDGRGAWGVGRVQSA